MTPHLVLALSSHGFGHIGQSAPVVDSLRKLIPDLRVTLRTAAPNFKLRERFGDQAGIEHVETDVGMVQQDAQCIALEASALAYREFHKEWGHRVDAEARELRALRADVLLANVPYLALAGAELAGIPSVAFCSINWMDIYSHYFAARPEADALLQQMREGYQSASVFLQPVPSMPMVELGNRRAIGPICQRGKNQRDSILKRLELSPDDRLVMVSLGGMELRPPVERWPVSPGVRLVVPGSWRSRHPGTVDFERLELPYVDALWSCDALICKPGYGSFVEAGCAGIPVLYLDRGDWPEVPFLVQWLESIGRSAPLPQERWEDGTFWDVLEKAWSMPLPSPVLPTGAQEAAEAIANVME